MRSREARSAGFWASLHLIAGWGELASLVVVALLALLFHVTLKGRLPKEEDYRAISRVLEQEARDADVLLLYPWWTERARLFTPASLPVVGYLGSDHDPLREFARIWVLVQPKLPRSDLEAFKQAFLPERTPLGETRSFGNLRLTLYRNDLYRPRTFDAADAHATATVYLERPNGERVDCGFDGKAHRCPGNLRVAPEWHELFYQPQRCLWMHPPGGPTKLVAEFHSVPVLHWLRLKSGIIWEYAPRHDPELTTTYVGVEESRSKRQLLRLAIPPGREGMQEIELLTPAAMGPTVDLKLWIQSDNATSREACVDLLSEGRANGDRS